MKYFLTIFSVVYLSSCVSIPIPPTGENVGSLGYLTLTFGYKFPRMNTEVYNSPTIRDK